MDLFIVKAVDYDYENIEGYTTDLEIAEKYVAKGGEIPGLELVIEQVELINEEDLKDIEVKYIYKYKFKPTSKDDITFYEIEYTSDKRTNLDAVTSIKIPAIPVQDELITSAQCDYLFIWILLDSKDEELANEVATDIADQFIKFSKSRENDNLHFVVQDFNDFILNKDLYLKRKKAEINKLQKQIDAIKEEINMEDK